MKDYYQILGVAKDASPEEIKKAFHKLAHKHHPHKGGDESKFKEINEAYQILSDKQKRDQYDKYGTNFDGTNPSGFDPSAFNWAWGNPSANQGAGSDEEGFEFDLGDLGGVFEDFFGGRGASSANQKRNLKRGRDIKIDIEVVLEDIVAGITKEITLHKEIVCSRCTGKGTEPGTKVKECFSCRGTGQVQQVKRTFLGSFTQWTVCPECKGEGEVPEKPCNVCKGEGKVKGEKVIKIYVPAGVDSNQMIKLKGEGNAGKRGGEAGDLYIRINVKPHAIFERKGDDLYIGMNITYSQAVLGDKIEVPTISGKPIILTIPNGTESGKILKISDKGIPHFSGYGKGSMFVELVIKTPRKPSRKQRELLEELKKEGL